MNIEQGDVGWHQDQRWGDSVVGPMPIAQAHLCTPAGFFRGNSGENLGLDNMNDAAPVLKRITFLETEAPSGAGLEGLSVSSPRRTAHGALEVASSPDIMLNGVSLELSRLHSRILAALLEGLGPLSTSRIAEIGWRGRFVAGHTVHSQIALLRARVLEYGLRITHVRGRGYVLE